MLDGSLSGTVCSLACLEARNELDQLVFSRVWWHPRKQVPQATLTALLLWTVPWAAEQGHLPGVHEGMRLLEQLCVWWGKNRDSGWPQGARPPPPLAQRYLWGTATIPVGTQTNHVVLCKLGSSLQIHCSATEWNLETFSLEGTSSLDIWMKKLRPREQAGGWGYTARREEGSPHESLHTTFPHSLCLLLQLRLT